MTHTRILIVDDHGSLRKSMADYLRRQDGIDDVREAANGVEALKMLHEGRFDILVTDIVMPMMDGYMLMEEMRRTQLTPQPRRTHGGRTELPVGKQRRRGCGRGACPLPDPVL